MSRSRRFFITLNNWTQEEYDAWWSFPCKYMVIGKEVGEQLTPHLHIYVEFETMKSFKQIKDFSPRANIQVAKGNSQQGREYATKDGDFVERGSRSMTQSEKGASEQKRWSDAVAYAKSGELDKIDDQIFLMHYNNLKRIQKDYMPTVSDLEDPCAFWFYGESNNGKSDYARLLFGDSMFSKDANKWWDGYQGEETALIEDIDPHNLSMTVRQFKIWADKYAFLAETKGGVIRIRPKRIVFTSQYTIEEVFGRYDQQTVDAISRRCKQEYVPSYKGTLRDRNLYPNLSRAERIANVMTPAMTVVPDVF